MYEDFQNINSLMNCYKSQLEVVQVSFQAHYWQLTTTVCKLVLNVSSTHNKPKQNFSFWLKTEGKKQNKLHLGLHIAHALTTE